MNLRINSFMNVKMLVKIGNLLVIKLVEINLNFIKLK